MMISLDVGKASEICNIISEEKALEKEDQNRRELI